MVIKPAVGRRERGSLMIELLVAMSLLTGAILPIAYSLSAEKHVARADYQRVIAMEIVDGEMEVLAAGEWRGFAPGVYPMTIRAGAATNLPPGKFSLTVQTNLIRLEWLPAAKHQGGPVVREMTVK